MTTIYRQCRRNVLKLAAAAPLAAIGIRPALAQEHLDPKSELAQQLGYHAEASSVDASQWPTYAEGQHCASCQLFTGEPSAAEAPCQIFGNQIVPAAGWCSAWVERAA